MTATQPNHLAFAAALGHVREFEGGYSNDRRDPGGPTSRGITLKFLREARANKGLTIKDLQALTDAEVAEIYRERVWNNLRADALPASIAFEAFDFGVNAGVRRAGITLQRAINDLLPKPDKDGKPARLKVDGVIGPVTISAAGDADRADLLGRMHHERMRFYRSIPGWKFYGRGWERRASASVVRASRFLPGAEISQAA